MKQFRIVSVISFCALALVGSTIFAFSGKKDVAGDANSSRDIASERDVASIENESKGVPKLLSYEELQALSPQQRDEYISGVRGMLLEMAAYGNSDFSLVVDGRSFQERYALLEALLPSANAQYENPSTPYEKINDPNDIVLKVVPRKDGSRFWSVGGEYWTCDSDKVKFQYNVGTCALKVSPAQKCGRLWHDAYITSGLIERIGSPVQKYCVPDASWRRLAPSRRNELQDSTRGAPDISTAFDNRIDGGKDKQIGADIALAGGPKKKLVPPWLAVPVQDKLRQDSNGTQYACYSSNPTVTYNDEVGTCTSREIGEDQNCSAGDWVKVSILRKDWKLNWNSKASWTSDEAGLQFKKRQLHYFCVTPASWAKLSKTRQRDLLHPADINVASNSEKKQAASGDGANASSVTVALPPVDGNKGAGKNEADKAAAAAKVKGAEVALGGAPCDKGIHASCPAVGSDEFNKAKEAYKKHVDVCVFAGNVSSYYNSHSDKGCRPVSSISNPKLSCAKGVICNPLIFGVQGDGKPYCVTLKENFSTATSVCDSHVPSGSNDWLNKNIGNVKEEWEKFRDGLGKVCGRKEARGYFCNECNVMMERLSSLAVLAKADGGESCSAPMMSYDEASKNVLKPAGAKQ